MGDFKIMVITVNGHSFQYWTATIDRNQSDFKDKHGCLVNDGYWQGTQSDSSYGYFKYIGPA